MCTALAVNYIDPCVYDAVNTSCCCCLHTLLTYLFLNYFDTITVFQLYVVRLLLMSSYGVFTLACLLVQ